jgi:hypothetical protein
MFKRLVVRLGRILSVKHVTEYPAAEFLTALHSTPHLTHDRHLVPHSSISPFLSRYSTPHHAIAQRLYLTPRRFTPLTFTLAIPNPTSLLPNNTNNLLRAPSHHHSPL